MVEILIDCSPDDFGHRESFCLGDDVDPPALLL
jgi:hypothetical protein